MTSEVKSSFPHPKIDNLVENKKNFVTVDFVSADIGSTSRITGGNYKNDMAIDYSAGKK